MNLPVRWSATDNVAWKLALPQWSGATPIIWDDTIFLNVAEADLDSLSLWAVKRTDGSILWKRPLSRGNHKERKQNMSSPSPVTDGTTVWAMTGTGILKAFDFAGKELWTRDIQKDYGRFGLNWGYANSPLLIDGDLIVPVLHGMKTDAPSYLLRIDGRTGTTQWRVERPNTAIRESPDAYITPAAGAVRRHFGNHHQRRGLRHRPRSGYRQGVVARRRIEPDQRPLQSHRRFAGDP